MSVQTKTKTKSKGWPKLGTLRESETGFYIKLDEGVEVYMNGEKLPMNDKRVVRLEDPRQKIEGLRDRGFITEQVASERLEKLAEHTWLKAELILAPPRD